MSYFYWSALCRDQYAYGNLSNKRGTPYFDIFFSRTGKEKAVMTKAVRAG